MGTQAVRKKTARSPAESTVHSRQSTVRRLSTIDDRLSTQRHSAAGFTLLEMVLAFTLLALFVLPMLEIIAASRARVTKFTQERIAADLAQRKLFDRMYYIELQDSGTFEKEGYPTWTWQVMPAEPIQGQGDSIILQYTVRVMTPQAQMAAANGGDGGKAFEMSAWTFPSQQWYEEQEAMGVDPSTGLPLNGVGAGSYGAGTYR